MAQAYPSLLEFCTHVSGVWIVQSPAVDRLFDKGGLDWIFKSPKNPGYLHALVAIGLCHGKGMGVQFS
jgi:hypothetical protein